MAANTRKRARQSQQGKKYRFVVKSAEEAVAVIREQLGENARVLDVNQIGGKGLGRFLSAPQLEVIATIVSDEEIQQEKAQRSQEAQSRRKTQKNAISQGSTEPALPEDSERIDNNSAVENANEASSSSGPDSNEGSDTSTGRSRRSRSRGARARPRTRSNTAQNNTGQQTSESNQPQSASKNTAQEPQRDSSASNTQNNTAAPAGQEASPSPQSSEQDNPPPLTPSGKETLDSLLKKARFDEELIDRIASGEDWERISKMQLNHGLSEVFYWLRNAYQQKEEAPIATRMAFMGTPGCGKTSALCKRMANDVFVHGKAIQVLKVEGESPNPDDALQVLCDVLGVQLYRDPFDLDKVDPDGDLYVDVPGTALHEREHWQGLAGRLDELYIETRVLVMNAAYEKEVIKEMIAMGEELGCTHQVFTHLDEIANVTKLWQFVLNSSLTTLFFSYGQNVTSEFTQDVLEFMTSKTFPSYLTS